MSSALLIVLAAVAAMNAVAWLAFRLDKARATRGARRIRERTLLGLAIVGGALGALVAMYGHRRRHKTAKRGFAAIVWLAAAAQLTAAGWWFAIARG